MQGETNKTQDEKRKSKIHTDTLKKYVDLLTGSRQIFSASVSLINKTSQSEEMSKDKGLRGYMDGLKLELGKYHTLILPEYQPNPDIEVFS